jgi:enoyl-CoA hydratase
MSDRVRSEIEGGVARITLDDGKANAMSPAWFAELDAALGRAEQDAGAVLVRGRVGFFSAGLDLKLLPTLAPEGLRELAQGFARTMLRVHACPVPTAAVLTGHAIAGGAVLALACDLRFAADGPFRFQMNEVAIGIPMPDWMTAIAESVVSGRTLSELLLHARSFAPREALARGLLDGVAAPGEDPEAAARAALAPLLALNRSAFGETKRRLRADRHARARERLATGG